MVGNPFSHLLDSFQAKKIFFDQYSPLDGFLCGNLKNFFFSKMVGNLISHLLESFEAKKIFFFQYSPLD